jgi:bacteriorhodopsin
MIVCGMAGSFAAAEAFRYMMFTAGCVFFLWLSILMYPVFCRSYKSYPEKCKPTVRTFVETLLLTHLHFIFPDLRGRCFGHIISVLYACEPPHHIPRVK